MQLYLYTEQLFALVLFLAQCLTLTKDLLNEIQILLPFYMLSLFSSSHIQMRVLAPLLRSYDHSVAGSLYARDRLGHHHLNP